MGAKHARRDAAPMPLELRVYSASEIGATLGGISEDSVRRLWDAGELRCITLTSGERRPRRGTCHADLLAYIETKRSRDPVQAPVPTQGLASRPATRGAGTVVPMRAVRRRKASTND